MQETESLKALASVHWGVNGEEQGQSRSSGHMQVPQTGKPGRQAWHAAAQLLK